MKWIEDGFFILKNFT